MKPLLILTLCVTPFVWAADNDLDALKEVIAKRNEDYKQALLEGNAEALAAFYTDDATTLFPGVPMVKGRASILEDKRSDFTKIRVVSADVRMLELSASGDLAYEIGTFSYTFAGRGGSTRFVDGRYVLIWRRGDDGIWRIQVDAGLPR